MNDNLENDKTALALDFFRLELADFNQDLTIQDVLASQQFPLFSKLPVECELARLFSTPFTLLCGACTAANELGSRLRLMIYRNMFPKGRRLIVYQKNRHTRKPRAKPPKQPVTSRVNSESRKETLKFYRFVEPSAPCLPLQFGPMLWNPQEDFLQCNVYAFLYDFPTGYHTLHEGQWNTLAPTIRRLELMSPKCMAPCDGVTLTILLDRPLKDTSNVLEIVLRKPLGSDVDTKAWRENFLKAFTVYKVVKARIGINFCIPVIKTWQE